MTDAAPDTRAPDPTATADAWAAASVLAGRYELGALLGEGGMAVVHRARDRGLNREVAVKLLKPGVPADSPAVTRFTVEAKVTGQLQHPGIPAVHELGTLPDGKPFLAMKLVKGQTLQELLQARPDPLHDRGRFIAIFEQVGHAVGYAHAHAVIHRDLKPSNVMVGAHGEVQVMDWGLAKVLSQSRDGEGADADDLEATVGLKTEIGTPPPDGPATRTGSVLGTPAYMPPEQGGGEIRRLDARSDVFGLGAILCQILTGAPPYRGREANEVRLQAVRWATADAFARLEACGAEPELVALCRRCLAREQEDRPADGTAVAREVAAIRQAAEERARRAELERARALVREAEQRKRRRQLLLAAGAIAAVLLVGVVGTSIGMWRANAAADAERLAKEEVEAERDAKARALEAETKARAAAKQARDQALAALRVMTDELVENQLARAATLTEENKAFLRKVIERFEGFAAITADDADSRAIRAEGYFRIGNMRGRLGALPDAEAAYRDALAIQKLLAAEFPTRPDFRQDLARSHNNLGVLLRDTGRPKDAEAAYRDALAIQKPLAAEFPTRPDFRQDLARSHNNLGALLSDTGRPKDAEAAYRDALAIQKPLAAEFPTRPDFRQDLARSHNNLGNLLRDTGRPKDAEAAYRDALAIQKPLAAEFPTRPDFRQELARSHNNLGNLLSDTGRPKDAEAAYRDALAIQKPLAAEFPTRPDFRQELAGSHNNLGLLLRNTGRPKDAEAAYRDALAIQKPLAAEFPTRPDFRHELATSHNNLGLLLRDTGRPKDAEAAYRDALAILKPLAAEFPTRPDFRQDLARSHNNLGALLRDTGRPKDAEAAFRDALAILKPLAAEFPTRPDFRQDLARSHNNLGLLLRDTGRPKDAEAAYRDALAIQKPLAAEFPTRPDFRQDLARSHNNLGLLLSDTGRPKDAEAAFRDALAIQKPLAAEFPKAPDYCNAVAVTLGQLAKLSIQRQEFAAAQAYLDEARPHHQAALQAYPRHPTYRECYHAMLITLVQAKAGLLDQAAAVQTAQTLRDLDGDQPGNAYDAACAVSLCIPLVAKHDKLDAEKRQAAAQFYGDAAMKLLRDAVAKGWTNAAHMNQDTDLDPLRKRADFQQLLAELEAKGK